MKTDITTTKAVENKDLPQLVKGSATYKMVVPEEVERKIRYLLRKFPRTEWSGVLFVTHTGTFEAGDLAITCKDIYPMDLGNEVYTEFYMSEDVTAYMAENMELFDCDLALVHSHHNMASNPSGTDLQTLRAEGNERNCFVSLIINNAGNYYAAITRKVKMQSEVTVKNMGSSYAFFGEGFKETVAPGTVATKTIEKETVEYFDLEIERHEAANDLEYLDKRFQEIERQKNSQAALHPVQSTPLANRNTIASMEDFYDWHRNKTNGTEGSLFEEGVEDGIEWQPNADAIHKAVVNLVTCNLNISVEKFDLKQWITRYMMKVYRKIFGELNERTLTYSSFAEYSDFMLCFLINYFDVEDAPEDMDEPCAQSHIAEAMMRELEPYKEQNAYIAFYYTKLCEFIV